VFPQGIHLARDRCPPPSTHSFVLTLANGKPVWIVWFFFVAVSFLSFVLQIQAPDLCEW
jgi:hypothetical protein